MKKSTLTVVFTLLFCCTNILAQQEEVTVTVDEKSKPMSLKELLDSKDLQIKLAPKEETKSNFFLEWIDFEDRAYSQNQKTQLGEEVELDMAFGWKRDNLFARFRFETDPEESSADNKTSRFELLGQYAYEDIVIAIDLELRGDDNSNGSTSLGIDTDSEFSRLEWQVTPRYKLTFYPLNFDGEVGKEFRTWDVTRIYSISGAVAPTTITATQGTQAIEQKTIPGIILDTKLSDELTLTAGGGIASYLYPSNEDFNMASAADRTVTRWKRKQDIGYRFGLTYRDPGKTRFELAYVGHTESKETGSLLEAAGMLYAIKKDGPVFLEGELTYTKAGERPLRLDDAGTWFEQTTVPDFQPVYSTYTSGQTQDWVGEAGFGFATRVGFEYNDRTIPYGLFRYQTEHMVYHREIESAHLLRDANEDLSHGGLTRVGFGSFLRYGKFTVNPEFEYMIADNQVFKDSSSVQQDRNLATYSKTDYLLTIFVKYNFSGENPFTP